MNSKTKRGNPACSAGLPLCVCPAGSDFPGPLQHFHRLLHGLHSQAAPGLHKAADLLRMPFPDQVAQGGGVRVGLI